MKQRTALALVIIAAIGCIAVMSSSMLGQFIQPDLRARRSPGFYFSASKTAAVFPVPEKGGSVSLVFFDRRTGQTKILRRDGSLRAPYLSADGQRLIAIRQRGKQQELLACTIANWTCRSLVQTENSLDWPVEIREGVIAYSLSPPVPWGDGGTRHASQDIWLWQNGSSKQLTNLQLYSLSAISFTNEEVFFSALGSLRTGPLLPKSDPAAKTQSEIFRLPFDLERLTVARANKQLQSQQWMHGVSSIASVSMDGEYIAFLNAQVPPVNYRYDVAVVGLKNGKVKRFESAGVSYSRPAFVNQSVFANDILDGRYRINLLDIETGEQQTMVEIPWKRIASGRMETKELSVQH